MLTTLIHSGDAHVRWVCPLLSAATKRWLKGCGVMQTRMSVQLRARQQAASVLQDIQYSAAGHAAAIAAADRTMRQLNAFHQVHEGTVCADKITHSTALIQALVVHQTLIQILLGVNHKGVFTFHQPGMLRSIVAAWI